ncbi:ATP-dependent RNA helicase HrpA [Thermobispora bispora]|uniref:RNA helicase n=1 Tax=Thermobispora bispora (strain ATCC 19993 / DSM 43833 / CBS 139.67 / JCM 10125 / KCTC 9307 / NBRC 14880 / R51) TaxID=469371 RepID=D6Y3T8_THEBD|nr:ATP-dependent RNA helicase HrpA [Thermobispora bispora]ADG89040.1 ATP-dependent helicase HrpA [Thermobispora bispora DSM 43833]QSI48766.1 ATP-dependent RNA helicase HrpA [Thermobispora bispora]
MDTLADLHSRLQDLMPRDRHRLRRRLNGVRKIRDGGARRAVIGEIAAELEAAQRRVEARRAAVPPIVYPPELPVVQRKDDLLAAVRDHQVVIVAGETGSGKTTQLPKICLELGRGVHGAIGHTQPRRIAARSVAARIAEELGVPLGDAVGYKVRFTDRSSDGTLIKLMTDGILLAELQSDPLLLQYDTIIIDEAHERSLNIDFILGYLKRILPRRPDLKVIITSATIDPESFARHFRGPDGEPAPIIEVSGRTYPVEVRYRPIGEDEDQTQAIVNAVDELCAAGPGDILVFLSGEREIRDTADALKGRPEEVLPLYARLSTAEQQRVFQPHRGRRIVLATNVAETSLTVPGIRYVIDPGTARISRYSNRLKVQRLPIEPISQASADQRKGRCGRTSDGICIRLYSEEDFNSRPRFTDPEILRTNLASVILQMAALKLGDVAEFPFVDPPDPRQIRDAYALLHELGAIEQVPGAQQREVRLTPIGRKLAQLPVDPRLGRMVLEAGRNGCAREVIIIAAALSIQDPRERPADNQQAADEKHRRFADKESDFLTFLNLWRYLQERQRELSSSAFRRMCKAEYLNYLRVREWQDIVSQLTEVATSLGIVLNSADADPDRIHQSLLAGLLSHIGLKDLDTKRRQDGRRPITEYLGARGARFAIFPGSALAKAQPTWVMSAELVETSRLWGRINAKIKPEWVEPLAQHLVKRSYSEPHWDPEQAAVIAFEKVTLYGVPIVTERKVNYGRIDPELSRELFIRHALVEGDWRTHHKFFHANRRLLQEVERLEEKARRRDILVDDETLFDFYDRRIPAEVVSGRHFDAWWKKASKENPDLLTFTPEMLINEGAGVREEDYPDTWRHNGHRMRLTYRFDPGAGLAEAVRRGGGHDRDRGADGVTVHIPLSVLNQVDPTGFEWQVPGLREELITELIRSLPKDLRRNFVPAPDYAKKVLSRVRPGSEPLLDALERELYELTGVRVPRDAWNLERIPDHLRITFRVVDERKRTLAESKDLTELKRILAPRLRDTLSKAAEDLERTGLRSWTIGTLPKVFQHGRMRAYPALVDETDSVAVRMFETEDEQRKAMWAGTRRLLMLTTVNPAKSILRGLTTEQKLTLSRSPHGSAVALFDDCVACAVDALMAQAGGPAWDEEGFRRLHDHVRASLYETAEEVVARVERALAAWHEACTALAAIERGGPADVVADVKGQLERLVYPGFVTDTGYDRLPHLARYLRAVTRRLGKLGEDPFRDGERMRQVQEVEDAYDELLDRLEPQHRDAPAVREIRWMIEELRVSLFAQQLGTPIPVSEKRIRKAMERIAVP